MVVLLRFIGIGSLLLGAVAFADTATPRWLAVVFVAAGTAVLLLARALMVYLRYRESFSLARRGAKKIAREDRRQGYAGFVPRSREALLIRRLLPGARRREEEARERVLAAVRPHLQELAVKRGRSVQQEFGREDRTRWDRTLTGFLETVLLGEVDAADLDRAVPFVYRWHPGVRQDDARATRYRRWARRMYCEPDGPLARLVEEALDAYVASDRYRMASVDADALDAGAYELHCARVLRECGWKAEVVGGSGDQGADVIAERGRMRVVIQCKKYSRSVGNDAVQQVIGGRMMFRAHAAAVVSPAPFTKAARELAAMTKVLLLHHTDLACLDRRLEELGLLKSEPTAAG